MCKDKAFSLVELMVVIAIIGILAGAAVPVYKKFILNSRFSSVIPVVDSIINKSITYAQTNGRFGNAYDLSLSTTVGAGHADSPSSVHPYFTDITITDWDSGGTPCGRVGYFNAYLNRDLIGFSSSIVGPQPNHLGIYCIFWNYQKIINKACSYYYGTQSVSQTEPLVPGSAWFNANTGTNWDYSNMNTYVYNQSSYINATCQ